MKKTSKDIFDDLNPLARWFFSLSTGTKIAVFLLWVVLMNILAVLILVGISSLFLANGMTGEEAILWMALPVLVIGLLALANAKEAFVAHEILFALLGFIGVLLSV